MRQLPSEMFDRWQEGGPFAGEGKVVRRFTVEPDWWLRAYSAGHDAVLYSQAAFEDPFVTEAYRAFQTAAQDQAEIEIPNVESWVSTISTDQDAGSFTLVLDNTAQLGADEISDRGHFSPYRASVLGNARWVAGASRTRQRERSEWNGILVENCLIRSYFGYGPDAASLPIDEAMDAGVLVRDGTWFADTVVPGASDGKLTINGRDAAKLLLDQRTFKPFIPAGLDPPTYQRWLCTYVQHGIELSLTNTDPAYADRWATPDPTLGWREWRMAYDIAVHPQGTGCWVLENWGRVAFMGVPWFGDPPLANGQSGVRTYRSIEATPTGEGYWVADRHGTVFTFGDAASHGSAGNPSGSELIRMRTTSTGDGYWMLFANGRVEALGDASWHGDLYPMPAGARVTDIVPGANDEGYYIRWRQAGSYGSETFAEFGGVAPLATFQSAGNGMLESAAVGLYKRRCDAPDTVDIIYVVSGFDPAFATDPDVEYIAGELVPYRPVNSLATLRPDMATPDLDYPPLVQRHLARVDRLQASGGGGYGTAYFEGSRTAYMQKHALPYFCAADTTPDGLGVVVLARDGSVYCFGTISDHDDYLSGWTKVFRSEGIRDDDPAVPGVTKTYQDYSDLLKDVLRWSGFCLYPETEVHGTIETTGSYSTAPLGPEVFDKVAPMRIIQMIKEATGAVFMVDYEGAAVFHSQPNWFNPGNRLEDGTHTDEVWQLDENLNLIDWTPTYADRNLRSKIIVGSNEQDASAGVTVITYPDGTNLLRGMQKPAAWWNGDFKSCDEAQKLADLIALYAYFGDRQGTAVVPYFPGLQPNDQAWIYEEVSGEYAIHYVRGIQNHWDRESGQANMTLTTHRLGTEDRWGVR